MKRLLSLVLCALLLVSLVVPVYAETDPTEATDATETTAAATDGATEASADAADDAVTELFNRLMSTTTYEELDEMMENMTEEEYELLGQFSDEQNAALTAHKNELSEYEQTTLADVTVEAGSSVTYTGVNNVSSVSDVIAPTGFSVTVVNKRIVVTVDESVAAGTYTVSGKYKSNRNSGNFSFTVEVTSSSSGGSSDTGESGKIKVYVYVAAKDEEGNLWTNNPEFLELLGISADTIDINKYFPVGEIYLDASYLVGKEQWSNTVGAALIRTEDDWVALEAALSDMDTTTLNDAYSANRNNKVPDYLDQAVKDIGQEMGSQKTALFRWNMSTSYGFDDQTVKYHLDLRFNTKKITFITGNNGITSGNAKDGTTVDSRVYITGSVIQEPRNLYIPDGYEFMGYYEDPDFKTPWNGIGTPLNEDQTVYIKITPKENVILNYKVAQGVGSLSLDNEALNPDTGVAQGSTATPGTGYTFEGWYADEACTQLLNEKENFIPTKPAGGWVDATYYAKFKEETVTINYVPVTGTSVNDPTGGSVTLASETINVISGTASGSTATPNTNYKFVGWFTDADCTQAVNSSLVDANNHFTPAKVEGKNISATYYAKFELDVGNLTITKTVDGVAENDMPAELAFTFTVSGPNGYEKTVILNADNDWTYTVPNLTVGDYTVVETKVDIANYKLTKVTANGTDVTNGTEQTTASEAVSVAGGATTEVNFVNTYALDIADLTIIKKGGSGELFEFSVVCIDRGIDMTVCVPGGGSITLKDLPLGTYTVKEDTGWSYRYSCSPPSGSVTIEANKDNSLTFTNTLTNDKWLGGESFARNIFTGSTGTTG